MSLFLLLQHSPTCLVCLILIVLEMSGRWPYSCCFVRFFIHDLLSMACSILVQFESSFFFIRLVNVYLGYLYTFWKCFILLDRSDFHMTENLSIAVHAFASHVLISFSVDEMLLLWLMNLSTSFRESPFTVEISPFIYLKLVSENHHLE